MLYTTKSDWTEFIAPISISIIKSTQYMFENKEFSNQNI